MSPAMAQTEKVANAGQNSAIPKGRAIVALKRIGAQIGLKAADMMLLDTLGAFSQAQDWEASRRPIVWPSNALLMAQTGFSLSALKRHIRRLAEAGVIAFHDSPNGKRWGHRDTQGTLVEAYGFDLSPLAARAGEFEALYAKVQAERTLSKRLKRQITVARRSIRARIVTAMEGGSKGPWETLTKQFETLLGLLPRRDDGTERMAEILDKFTSLQSEVDAACLRAEDDAGSLLDKTPEMDPKGAENGPHLQTTNEPKSEESKHWEKGSNISLTTILQACPEFTSWAKNIGGFVKNWGDLHRTAGSLGPMIGIPIIAWKKAQETMGLQQATAAVALVFEKHAAGEIASPAGYLRGIMRKATMGELHLERSFYGRLNTA